MKTPIKLFLISLTLLSLITTGCKDDGCTDPLAVNYDIDAKTDNSLCIYPELTLDFKQMVGSQDLTYGQEYTVNGTKITFSLFQYYISNIVSFDDTDLSNLSFHDTYLLVKPTETQYALGQTFNDYTSFLRFDLGIDAATNAQSSADFAAWPADHPLAAQSPAMHWNWNLGYIFFKIEGKVDSDGDGTVDQDFIYHVGTDNMKRAVAIIIDEDLDEANKVYSIQLDLEKVLNGIDFSVEASWDTHTGNNPDLAKQLADNFVTAFSKQ